APMVADLPTCQNTFEARAPPFRGTCRPTVVTKVLAIWSPSTTVGPVLVTVAPARTANGAALRKFTGGSGHAPSCAASCFAFSGSDRRLEPRCRTPRRRGGAKRGVRFGGCSWSAPTQSPCRHGKPGIGGPLARSYATIRPAVASHWDVNGARRVRGPRPVRRARSQRSAPLGHYEQEGPEERGGRVHRRQHVLRREERES